MRKSLKKIKSESKAKENRRKLYIRKKVTGSAERPRICAGKSNGNLFVQVVDDAQQKTLFSVQTFGKNKVTSGANKESAKIVGTKVAELLKDNKIERAVYDRNGKKYTGVISVLADAIRENGIQI